MSAKRMFGIFILACMALLIGYRVVPAIPLTGQSRLARPPLGAWTSAPSANFVWDNYEPRTFQDVIELNINSATGQEPVYISIELYRSQVTATFAGQSRPVSGARMQVIERWLKVNQANTTMRKLFLTEWLFTVDGSEYWVPVQASAAERLIETVQPGEDVSLLVVLLGASRVDDQMDWLFVANEFLVP